MRVARRVGSVPYPGLDPFVPIDAPCMALGIAMVFATIAQAVGRPARLPVLGLAR